MTPHLHLDFETRSDVDLKRAGVYRYAEDATTAPWGFAWRITDASAGGATLSEGRWMMGEELPFEVHLHVEQGLPVVAHNAAFERVIWNWNLRRRPEYAHWPELKIEQQICTMARAAALALPQALDSLTVALKTKSMKDMEGHKLMMKMCRPRMREFVDGKAVLHWHDTPEQLERLMEYCANDVAAECHVDLGIPYLSERETEVWRFDQIINERGVKIDEKLVGRALDAVMEALRRADERMWYLTDGEVMKCSEVARIISWLNHRGIPCESVAKGEIDELICGAQLFDDEVAEEVVRLRRMAAKSSTAKFKAMLNSVCRDGRVRGTLAYHGASTGRWAGRLIQPQNFPRVDPDRDLPNVERVLPLLETRMSKVELVDAIELVTDGALDTLSKCLRAMIIAAPGMKLAGGDFSNIEGRVNAWLAGEDWKLDAFRAYDAGTGPDLYKVTSAAITGKQIADVTKAERQATGKVPELALGYQGGVGAFINMAANYGTKPRDVAFVSRAITDPAIWEEVKAGYEESNSYGLAPNVWTGIKVVVNGWRAKNACIVQGWWDLQDAAIEAVSSPGLVAECYGGRVRYLAANGFLFCSLPSKRVLAYACPRLLTTERNGRKRNVVQYDGIHPMTKKWGPQTLYGGEQCNHVVQGTARDLIVEAMFNAEAEGFPVILTVHDELLCEVPECRITAEGAETFPEYAPYLERIMSELPAWAEGLPLAAAAWEDYRYVK